MPDQGKIPSIPPIPDKRSTVVFQEDSLLDKIKDAKDVIWHLKYELKYYALSDSDISSKRAKLRIAKEKLDALEAMLKEIDS